MNMELFNLYHLEKSATFETNRCCGVFSSSALAYRAKRKLRLAPGFLSQPNGFSVAAAVVNQAHWHSVFFEVKDPGGMSILPCFLKDKTLRPVKPVRVKRVTRIPLKVFVASCRMARNIFEEVISIGIFSSLALAKAAWAKSRELPGFCDERKSFRIFEMKVNETLFKDGFIEDRDIERVCKWDSRP